MRIKMGSFFAEEAVLSVSRLFYHDWCGPAEARKGTCTWSGLIIHLFVHVCQIFVTYSPHHQPPMVPGHFWVHSRPKSAKVGHS